MLVHPDGERYKHLHGKHAVLPIYGRDVPIYPHTYAKPEFGSGVVMVCSYGDTGDIQIFRELQLEPIAAIDENARMTEAAGKYKGLTTKQAREAIINDLRDAGLLLKQTDLVHSTPICERCNTPVEYISLKEWYIKQLEFLDDVKRVANKIKFHPQKNKQILLDWIDSITIDWPISRRRYYHTEIPLWYCKKCGKALVPEPGKYYRPWRDPAPFDKCPKCGGTEFKGEEKVFDTWVDSSISNLYVCGYKRNDALFEKAYPTALRPQGREIVRTWLYYSLLRNKQLMNEPAFKDVVITGLGLAEDGKKMSKSKGNYVEPMPIIEEVGADAWRLWGAGEVTTGDDFRMSKERMLGASKFLTKLWNVARFISSFEDAPRPKKLNDTDAWILAECNKMARKAIEGYEEYNLSAPAWAVRDFIWNIFASHYVEMAKARAYEGDASALYTLHECLRNTLKILAPISPFITDKVYKELYNGKIHYEEFSKPSRDKKHVELTEKVIEFNSMVWKKKKDANLSLRADLTGVPVPDELKPFAADLIKMHNLK